MEKIACYFNFVLIVIDDYFGRNSPFSFEPMENVLSGSMITAL